MGASRPASHAGRMIVELPRETEPGGEMLCQQPDPDGFGGIVPRVQDVDADVATTFDRECVLHAVLEGAVIEAEVIDVRPSLLEPRHVAQDHPARQFAHRQRLAILASHGEDGTLNETSYVAGLAWEYPLSSRVTVIPMVEYAHVKNQGGADLTADYITVGLGAELGQGWSASAHATIRPIDDDAAPDEYTDHLLGFSVGTDQVSIRDAARRGIPALVHRDEKGGAVRPERGSRSCTNTQPVVDRCDADPWRDVGDAGGYRAGEDSAQSRQVGEWLNATI